jgi:hypothetical protein
MKKLTLILFGILAIQSYKANAQKFHAFLFCKTADPKIAQSVIINYAKMQVETQKLARALNMEYVGHSIIGADFTSQHVKDTVANATIATKDIVFIYFSTHGAKSRYDTTIFPQLDIPSELVSAYGIHQQMSDKHPAMLVTMIEACSGYLNITPQEAFVLEQSGTPPPNQGLTAIQTRNIGKLFSGPCRLIVTAGQPGKITWATSEGSMFTNSFLRALDQYIDMPAGAADKVSWSNVLGQAKSYTDEITRNTPVPYFPVWETDDCGNGPQLKPQIDSTLGAVRDVVFKTEVQFAWWRIHNRHDVILTVKYRPMNGLKIDSVTYFLDKTFKQPVVTVKTTNNNFYYKLGVWGTFPIKAKVYFNDGRVMDLYKNFNFASRLSSVWPSGVSPQRRDQ